MSCAGGAAAGPCAVFRCLEDAQRSRNFEGDALAIAGLAPTLRGYQSAAVRWMMDRETVDDAGEIRALRSALLGPCVGATPPLRGGILADEMGLGKTVTVIALTLATAGAAEAYASEAPAPVAARAAARRSTRSMAVGIAAGRYRRRCLCGDAVDPGGGDASCDACGAARHAACADALGDACAGCARAALPADALPRSRATLIACPPTIGGQWKAEMRRHAPRLAVAEYPGIVALQRSAQRARGVLARPRATAAASAAAARELRAALKKLDGSSLRDSDVVLTTFSALRSDRHYLDGGGGALVNTAWFRACVDEAQEIKGGATAAATVARAVPAARRWCVSGTPVSVEVARGAEDARGLFEFLGAPLAGAGAAAWRSALSSEAAAPRLAALLEAIAWRATKRTVAHAIPPQMTVVRDLAFGPVERYVYDALHEECGRDVRAAAARAVDAAAAVEACSAPGGGISRLRQACVHPALGSRRRRARNGRKRRRLGDATAAPRVATMAETMWRLVSDAQAKAEEAQRVAFAPASPRDARLFKGRRTELGDASARPPFRTLSPPSTRRAAPSRPTSAPRPPASLAGSSTRSPRRVSTGAART